MSWASRLSRRSSVSCKQVRWHAGNGSLFICMELFVLKSAGPADGFGGGRELPESSILPTQCMQHHLTYANRSPRGTLTAKFP
jgi:hypothetical protein